MNVQRYIREVTPLNILDLLDPSVLDNLLSGYSFALGTGITVVYPTAHPVTVDALARRDARGTEARSTFHPLCASWRDPETCNQEQCCIEADKQEALKYVDGDWSGPRLYRCQPLSLWKMTFPLRIESRVVGVLFGGQIIVDDISVNWQEALSKYSEYVDWRTCPQQDSHLQAVKERISALDIPEGQKRELLCVLDSDLSNNSLTVGMDEFRRRIDDFLQFGKISQGLLDELHKVQKTAAEQGLLRRLDTELTSVGLADEAQWWVECGHLLNRLAELPEIEDIFLYARRRSRYFRKVPPPTDPKAPERLSTRDVVPFFSSRHLVAVPDVGNADLVANLGLGEDNIWAYRSQTGDGHEACSTLIVIQGSIQGERESFLANLCGVFCTATDLAELIFRLRATDLDFRHQVGLIGHSFRTPLQALRFVLEDLEKSTPVSDSPEMQEKIDSGMDRIRDAREDLRLLLDSATEHETTFDLVEVLDYVIASMKPISEKHPCVIVKQDRWPANVSVRAIRYRVQRALTCLLDNAIKYSFHGQRRDGGGPFQVRVGLVVEANYVKAIFVNYGIGFPEHKIEALKEYGVRGEVADRKKLRLGTGLGLPFAIDTFEEAGGWIHVTSIPAGLATEWERQNYHRYITTVEAALPVLRRN